MPARAADKLYHHVNHLFSETLRGGTNADEAWDAVRSLRRLGCQLVFDRAKAWCSSPEPMKRTRAADVLAQLHRPMKPKPALGSSSQYVYRQESFELIARMLGSETDLGALDSELIALGFLEVPEAVPLLVRYADHPDENIRHAVTRALNHFANDQLAVAALTKLADDNDKDNRDWAIFALGVIGDADSEELRQLFLAHLDDPFLDARIEAACALGKRRDARLAAPLIRMFRRNGARHGLIEAAKDLLEMDKRLPDWFENEYIAALEAKFPAAWNSSVSQHTETST